MITLIAFLVFLFGFAFGALFYVNKRTITKKRISIFMTITADVLQNFNYCEEKYIKMFEQKFPDGLDISGLYGPESQAEVVWKKILSDSFLKKWVGWAIREGLLPARIRADLTRTNLIEANLIGADLSRSYLIEANLRRANLRGANLRGADLSEVDLSFADLRWADLIGANLTGAKLSNTNLYGAILIEAALIEADLSSANLCTADLSGANLNGAKLTGANLTDIIKNEILLG